MQIKEESKRRWDMLPSHTQRTKEEKMKFKLLPLTEQQSVLAVGGSQVQRCNLLRLASRSGNVDRVVSIIIAGVDVDNRNEYGQTALFLAAWNGNEFPFFYFLAYRSCFCRRQFAPKRSRMFSGFWCSSLCLPEFKVAIRWLHTFRCSCCVKTL